MSVVSYKTFIVSSNVVRNSNLVIVTKFMLWWILTLLWETQILKCWTHLCCNEYKKFCENLRCCNVAHIYVAMNISNAMRNSHLAVFNTFILYWISLWIIIELAYLLHSLCDWVLIVSQLPASSLLRVLCSGVSWLITSTWVDENVEESQLPSLLRPRSSQPGVPLPLVCT
jgi:hypothetical protein